MRKGGYKIIDLKDTNFTISSGVVIEGIYERIEGNYRKPLLLSGLTIDSVEYADAFVTAELSVRNYVIKVYGKVITIEENDTVTITEPVMGAKTK